MRIKLSQLRRIIKEEAYRALHESYSGVIEQDYASPPANRGQRSADADAAILALLNGADLDEIPQDLTRDDLDAALTDAIAKRIVPAGRVQEIENLLQQVTF